MRLAYEILAVLASSCRFPGTVWHPAIRFEHEDDGVGLPPVVAPSRKSRSREQSAAEMCLFPASAPLDMLELRGMGETWGELEMAG